MYSRCKIAHGTQRSSGTVRDVVPGEDYGTMD
jgi:hypothetical protein